MTDKDRVVWVVENLWTDGVWRPALDCYFPTRDEARADAKEWRDSGARVRVRKYLPA